jgi:hypothetical protein
MRIGRGFFALGPLLALAMLSPSGALAASKPAAPPAAVQSAAQGACAGGFNQVGVSLVFYVTVHVNMDNSNHNYNYRGTASGCISGTYSYGLSQSFTYVSGGHMGVNNGPGHYTMEDGTYRTDFWIDDIAGDPLYSVPVYLRLKLSPNGGWSTSGTLCNRGGWILFGGNCTYHI